MKAESDTMPTHPFVIDKRGELADITFFEGVKESEREDRTVFEYDSHTLTVPYRLDLEEVIAADYDLWLGAAKDDESFKLPPLTLEERVADTENKVVSLEETIDVLFGGAI